MTVQGPSTRSSKTAADWCAGLVLIAHPPRVRAPVREQATVSGSALRRSLVERSNTQAGVVEIWTARTTAELNSRSVTVTASRTGCDGLLALGMARARCTPSRDALVALCRRTARTVTRRSARGCRRYPGSTLMARAITRTAVISEIAASTIIVSFAHVRTGNVSVGLNAVALVKDRYR